MTAPAYPLGERVDQVLARRAAEQPEAEAVRQGERSLTYGELEAGARTVAAALHARGIGAGDRVAVRLGRCPELAVALLGVLRAGAAYVAVDPAWPDERVAACARGTGIVLFVTDGTWGADGAVADVALEELTREGLGRPVPPQLTDGGATASVFFTSGSTGVPKGVLSPHRGVVRLAFGGDGLRMDRETVFLQSAALPWDMLSLELWGPLLAGGRCVLLDRAHRIPDAGSFAAAVGAGVNSVFLATSLFNVLVEEAPQLFASLRVLMVGGERVSAPHLREVVTRYPSVRLVNGYGPAECSMVATMHTVRPQDVADGVLDVPIGRPAPRTSVLLLDAEGRAVPDGEEGEIVLGGDGVAAGYAGDPRETGRRFPVIDGRRHYRTGDLGVLDAGGLLRFRGRVDHQFKVNGVRTEPGEIEVVLEEHPRITAVCVSPLRDAAGRVSVGAAYVTADQRELPAAGVREFAAQRLVGAMVPSVLLHVTAMPLNANGKADRAAVADALREYVAAGREAAGAQEGPVDPLLAQARELLGLPGLAQDDDLMLSGAGSLDVIRLAARLGARRGTGLGAADIYRLRTLAAIREHCAGVPQGSADLLACEDPRGDTAPLSHAQQRFWLAEMTEPGAADNLIVLAWSVTGPLDARVLEEALGDVVALHPALRTTYPWLEDAPAQRVRPVAEAGVRLERTAVPAGADGKGPQELAEAVTADWWDVPFSLEEEVPVALRLCELDDERALLCLKVHHIAFDGWSAGVLMEDLAVAYRERGAGRQPRFGTRATYRGYAVWEAERLERLAVEDLPFWRGRLTPEPVPFLPAPAESGQAPRHESVFRVGARTVRGLALAAARRGGPLLAVVLAATARAVAAEFGADAPALGSVTAGRFDPALEPVVGYFVNPFTVPMPRVRELSDGALLDQAVGASVAALSHTAMPFDDLVRRLTPSRERHPFFQAWAVLQAPVHGSDLGGGVCALPVRVRPPATAIELMTEVFPQPDGSWEGVVLWRRDGVGAAAAQRVAAGMRAALERMAEAE